MKKGTSLQIVFTNECPVSVSLMQVVTIFENVNKEESKVSNNFQDELKFPVSIS